MTLSGDRDSKTKVALPTHEEIAERAYKLWLDEGRPSDSAEANWQEAERELRASRISRALAEKAKERSGSVQP
jgi:hypothetical protein